MKIDEYMIAGARMLIERLGRCQGYVVIVLNDDDSVESDISLATSEKSKEIDKLLCDSLDKMSVTFMRTVSDVRKRYKSSNN